MGGCDWLFKTSAPTTERIIKGIKQWGVPCPENVTLVNYALNPAFGGEGEWIYILEYSGSDEDFINCLSDEQDYDVVNEVKQACNRLKDKFNEPYTIPKLYDGYYWLYEGRSNGGSDFICERFYVIYAPSENQILVLLIHI